MSLVPSAFAESWGIVGMTLCQTSDYSMKLIRGLLPAQSVNASSGYTVTWPASRALTLHIGFSL